jgi:putative ABC transport system permease protein
MRRERMVPVVWLAAYRVATWTLPARLRRRRAREMAEVFAERWREVRAESGRIGAAWFGASELLDVAVTGVRLRSATRQGVPRGTRPADGRADTGGAMEAFWLDVRHSVRSWVRRPGFALVTVVTLALAVGANTVMFSVLDAALFEPLPYRDAKDLAMIWQRLPQVGWDRGPVSYPNFVDFRTEASSFADMAAFRTRIPHTLRGESDVEQIRGSLASGNLFGLLGVQALHGRVFTEDDARPDAPAVVVLSEALWRRRFGGDPGIIGRSLTINARPYTVIGVMAARFDFPSREDELWVPLRGVAALQDRDTHFLQAIGRLRQGATLASAQAEMQVIFDRMRLKYPEVFRENQPNVESRRDFVAGDSRPVLLLLFGSVVLLLGAACANLANLTLIHGTARSRELSVRAAMGAGRRRLFRQLLTESALLSLAGAALGVAVAAIGTRAVLWLGPESLPRRNAIDVDTRAVAFTLVAAVLSVVLTGLVPALRASRAELPEALRGGVRTDGSRRTSRLQRGLVVAQVAVAMVLLCGSGLLLNSFLRLTRQAPGFDAGNILTVRVAPSRARYPQFPQFEALLDRLLERTRGLPGVRGVAATWAVPFGEDSASGRIVIEGVPTKAGEEPMVGMYPVRGDYFGAMRIPLLRGRLPGPEDTSTSPPVAVINEAMANRFWPGQDPIGRRYRRGDVTEVESEEFVTVVGVVASVRRFGFDDEPTAEEYAPHAQMPWAREMYLLVRTERDPLGLIGQLRAEMRALDPESPLTRIGTMSEMMSASVAQPRFRAFLVTSFAALAALLALVGVYGMLAFAVAQRRREIGVRLALGARKSQVLAGVMRQGATLVAVGLALGLAGALAASQWVSAMLFEITPLDVPTYGVVAAFLATCGLLACYLPARRASRLDPAVVLREH